MEKNIYQVLNDWHELLKTGAITEKEFSEKKRELLGNGEKEKSINTEDSPHILSAYEQEQIDAEYNELFNSKNWFQRHKGLLIGVFILLVSIFIFWNYNRSSSNINSSLNTENIESESTNSAYYIINASALNLVHFYKSANIKTKKRAYFNSVDTVYVQKFENGFGYIEFQNSKGQTSKGWVKIEDLSYCSLCGK